MAKKQESVTCVFVATLTIKVEESNSRTYYKHRIGGRTNNLTPRMKKKITEICKEVGKDIVGRGCYKIGPEAKVSYSVALKISECDVVIM